MTFAEGVVLGVVHVTVAYMDNERVRDIANADVGREGEILLKAPSEDGKCDRVWVVVGEANKRVR